MSTTEEQLISLVEAVNDLTEAVDVKKRVIFDTEAVVVDAHDEIMAVYDLITDMNIPTMVDQVAQDAEKVAEDKEFVEGLAAGNVSWTFTATEEGQTVFGFSEPLLTTPLVFHEGSAVTGFTIDSDALRLTMPYGVRLGDEILVYARGVVGAQMASATEILAARDEVVALADRVEMAATLATASFVTVADQREYVVRHNGRDVDLRAGAWVEEPDGRTLLMGEDYTVTSAGRVLLSYTPAADQQYVVKFIPRVSADDAAVSTAQAMVRAEAAADRAAVYGPITYKSYDQFFDDANLVPSIGKVAQIMGGGAVSIVPAGNGDYDSGGAGVTVIPNRDNFWVSLAAWGVKEGDDIGTIANTALAKYLHVSVPAGDYTTSREIRITRAYGSFVGAGQGVTKIRSTHAGRVIYMGAASDAVGIPHRQRLAGFTLDGGGVGGTLHVRRTAESTIEDNEFFYSTSDALFGEIVINSRIRNNAARWCAGGIHITDGTQSGIEYRSGANTLQSNVCNDCGPYGIRIRRSYANTVVGGDCSRNEIGLWLDGGGRCSVYGMWLEANTVAPFKISANQSTGGVTYGGDHNLIDGCMISSDVAAVLSGAGNVLRSNYWSSGSSLVIESSATKTVIEPQKSQPSSLTDNGNGTINRSDVLNQIYKVGGFERFKMNVGTTVDMTSNSNNIRIAGLRGISQNTTPSNNLRGSVTISSTDTFTDVSFATAETSAGYTVTLTPRIVSGSPTIGSWWVSNQGVNGFRINLSVAPGASGIQMHWQLIG